MHPKNLSISDYNYHLPDERIAKYPLDERDKSKLLVYKSGRTTISSYKEIDAFLPADSLLVFNNTKVVEARLLFQKATGAQIEVFCLEPHEKYPDITTAMLQKGSVWWKCLIGGASKWKHGMKLQKFVTIGEEQMVIEASIVERLSDCFVIELTWKPEELSFAEMLHAVGAIPLPPYLHREVEEDDKNRYQTVYAKHNGSVAAPTAGLHFTNNVFEKLEQKGIKKTFVTLHVGAGTFKPVKTETIEEHEMHAEFIDVTIEAIEDLLANINKTIIAVGTTSMRTIESLYWLGVKISSREKLDISSIAIRQWDPYEITQRISAKEALSKVINWMKDRDMTRLVTRTQILIAPGYKLKIAKGIITNFHQPKSTLLLLIAAIVGDKWKELYQHAMDNEFRFLSYGDGCLLMEGY